MKEAIVLPFVLQQRAKARPVDPLVSCVIPAYNEALNIVALLQTLHQLLNEAGFRHELVVVDDGSRDDTVQRVLTETAGLPVTLVQLSRNFGKEIALTAGLDQIQGDVAVLIDGDFQHPPEMVPEFLRQWRAGYDMVYSVWPNRDHEGLGKRLFTKLFYLLLNAGSRNRIPENSQDFRVLDRCIIDALRQMPERNRFMKGLYNWVGFTQLGIATQTQARVEVAGQRSPKGKARANPAFWGRNSQGNWIGTSWDVGVSGEGPYAINETIARRYVEIEARMRRLIDDLAGRAFPDGGS